MTEPRLVVNPWTEWKTAVAFLTRLPVRFAEAPPPLAQAAWAFPLIGLVVALPPAGVLLGAAWLGLPHLVCALLAVMSGVLITGGLHEDGLADVADGFGGSGEKARKLEIMRDSRIGSYGVLALIFSIGLKVAALAGYPGPVLGGLALLGGAVFSRSLMPLMMRVMPPARDDGLGQGAGRPSGFGVAVSLVLGLAGALVLPVMLAGPVAGAGVLAAALVVPLLLAVLAKRQIGGQTGDVLGAAQQVGEVAFLVSLGAIV